MTVTLRHVLVVIWQYFNQPLFDASNQFVWRPSQFWYRYQIRFLEICWQIEFELERHSSTQREENADP